MKLEILKESEKAYIAGILDADGSICLVHQNKDSNKLRPMVTLYNTNILLLEWINNKFPKGHIAKPRDVRKGHWKKVYVLNFTSRMNCQELLEAVYPYLIVKQRQAEIVIRFCRRHQGRSTYNKEDAQEFDLMCRLNRRGPQ